MTAVVTDTEESIIAAGRMMVRNAEQRGGVIKWHGCIDHLLELVIGIAFKDLLESHGTMSACRTLINYFNSSSQEMAKLLSKQIIGRAVKPSQDVVTCWWSTWSMVDRLMRLKTYLALMEEEGDLPCNLHPMRWLIVRDLQAALKPFMIAQKLLEGQSYTTISLIPYLVYKVRKNLEALRDSPASSPHVLSIATRMLVKLEEIFGSGVEGTVAAADLPEGPQRRPRGIPILVLMSSLLDPPSKGGVGIPNADQEFIWEKIRSAIILISQDLDRRAQPHPLPANNNNANNDDNNNNQRIQQAAPREPNDLDTMFEELNEFYMGQQQRQNQAVELVADDADV